MSTPPPTSPDAPGTCDDLDEWPAPSLRAMAPALALLALGLATLVVALATRDLRIALFQVLPVVLAMLAGGGGCALWLLGGRTRPLALLVAAPAAATTAALLATVVLLAVGHHRSLAVVMARPLVERGLAAAPVLGALIGAGLWLLVRARRRELAAWRAQELARQATEAAQAREARLDHERTLAHLQLLQAQIEPHFIYNTLANLRQLVRMDGARALQMLDHLIRYFKLVLPSFRSDRLPLRDELALVRAYLDLLQDRMGRAMELHADLPEEAAGLSLLPGALLCLAENAVKHGLPDDGALRLTVTARRAGRGWQLSVRDNGSGLQAAPTTPRTGGTGLANLRERLRLLHGADASLTLHNAHPGCEAVLTLPWEDAECAR